MRIFASIVLLFIFCVVLIGCGIPSNENKPNERIDISDNPNPHPWSISYNMSVDIEFYMLARNAHELKNLFSEACPVRVEDVNAALTFIDGEIAYFDQQITNSGVKESVDGIYTIYTYSGSTHLHTTANKEYIVYYTGVAAWQGNPQKIGLESLRVVDIENKDNRYNVGR